MLEEYLETAFLSHFERLCSWLDEPLVPKECVQFAFAVSALTSEGSGSYRKRNTVEVIRHFGKKQFEKQLNANNGLKTQNVEVLARALGADWSELESALNIQLADLDTLGHKRGAAGHLSPYTNKINAISTADGPDQIREWVRNGQDAVEAVGQYLDRLCPPRSKGSNELRRQAPTAARKSTSQRRSPGSTRRRRSAVSSYSFNNALSVSRLGQRSCQDRML
nr:hypothetical protein [Tessaracoccus sp. ZS01]